MRTELQVAKAGHGCLLHIADEMHIQLHAGGLIHHSQGSSQLAKRAGLIGRLNGIDGSSQRILVELRLAHRLDMRVDGQHLRKIPSSQIRNDLPGCCLRPFEILTIAHTEGPVDGDDR